MGRCKFLFPVFKRHQTHYVHHKYHRGIEPSVPESHENQECISKRCSPGKDAVSCQRKCSQEMDTEISELGSGVESADCLVWRTAYQLSVRKEKQEWICSKADHSRFLSIPSAFVLLPGFPDSIPEVGCGQRPRKKQLIQCLICHAKKSKRMYKILSDGYTVNRKIDSTTTES